MQVLLVPHGHVNGIRHSQKRYILTIIYIHFHAVLCHSCVGFSSKSCGDRFQQAKTAKRSEHSRSRGISSTSIDATQPSEDDMCAGCAEEFENIAACGIFCFCNALERERNPQKNLGSKPGPSDVLFLYATQNLSTYSAIIRQN